MNYNIIAYIQNKFSSSYKLT